MDRHRPDPHCSLCMDRREYRGISYKREPNDNQWYVFWEGRETDTMVGPVWTNTPAAWLVTEFRGGDGVIYAVDVYYYERLADFEDAYIARAGRERIGDGSGPHLSDKREGPPTV